MARIVVALGGNALLKRGEPMTADAQRTNVRKAATAIADLARARLYPRGAPEGVETAAKAATRTLERIASGALQLGLPAIETPPATAPSEAPVMILSGRRAYPDGLVDF